MDWFPWFPHDFRRDTYHLSLAEDGAYRRLIDEYMISREALPNDDGALAKILGIPKAEWEDLAPRIRTFFRARNDRLFHKRCEEELRAQELRHNRNSERAKKAAFARYSKINNLPARRMLAPATLHNKDKTSSSEYVAPREAESSATPAPSEKQKAGRQGITVTSELETAIKAKGWA